MLTVAIKNKPKEIEIFMINYLLESKGYKKLEEILNDLELLKNKAKSDDESY